MWHGTAQLSSSVEGERDSCTQTRLWCRGRHFSLDSSLPCETQSIRLRQIALHLILNKINFPLLQISAPSYLRYHGTAQVWRSRQAGQRRVWQGSLCAVFVACKTIVWQGYHFGLLKLEVKTKTDTGVEFTTGGSSNTESGLLNYWNDLNQPTNHVLVSVHQRSSDWFYREGCR